MLSAERLQKIARLVNEQGSVRVSELSRLFGVTEETIRRDLVRLENEGKLIRSHGGAISVREAQSEVPHRVREVTRAEEKRRIAAEAVRHIREGDRLVLDASTTACYVARLLPDIRLTVLTNSIQVALELCGKEKIDVVSAGGQLARRSLSYVGPLAERSLAGYRVDKAFLSCKGIHPDTGAGESNEWQAHVKRVMIDISEHVFLLADSSKLGVRPFTAFASPDEIDLLITDDGADAGMLARLEERGIRVTVAGPAQVYYNGEGNVKGM